MSVVAYASGATGLVVALVALGFAGYHTRRLLVPRWQGSLARLAEVLVGLGVLTVLLEAAGTVGLLRPVPVMVGVPAAALGLGVWARRLARPDPTGARPPPASSRLEVVVACATAGVVSVQWIAHAAVVFEGGLRDMDSLRYHAPFAANWVQQHSLVHLQHTSSELQETFFPANAELLHAYGILLFGRDILTPLLNLGWYALGLLAAWCAPASSRGRAVAMAGFAALCSTPLLSSIEPGSAKNDMAATVLALCVAVFVVHGRSSRGAPLLVGLTAGLAVGTKLTVLGPVVILAGGAVWLAGGERSRAAGRLLGAAALTGSFWYVRNFVHTGNPLPWLRHLGPVALDGPTMAGVRAHGFSVLHYLTDGRFWARVVPAGLSQSFGPLWPLVLVGPLAFGAVRLAHRRSAPEARLVGLAALAGGVAYLATPFSAGGSEGHPTLFALDLRFLAPALVLGVVSAANSSRIARPVLAAAVGLTIVDQWAGQGRWPAPTAGAIRAAGVVVVLIGAVALAVRLLAGLRLLAASAVVLAALGVGGWPVQAAEMSNRYAAVHSGLTEAFAFFRETHGLRIAVAGFADDYPLFGADLSNRVTFVGVSQPDGGFRPTRTCHEWRSALAAGRYDYVVASRSPLARQRPPVETSWTTGDPAARLVLARGPTSVFRLVGTPDPTACPTEAK